MPDIESGSLLRQDVALSAGARRAQAGKGRGAGRGASPQVRGSALTQLPSDILPAIGRYFLVTEESIYSGSQLYEVAL